MDKSTSDHILHVDCDCFFAAVEMRENPSLKTIPMAVGGDKDRRGVLTTCNYPAREFGIKSAMPTALARQLCPDLIVLPGRMSLYKDVSRSVMAILRGYSQQIEIVSIDEAYIKLPKYLDSESIAETIRIHIKNQLGISVSIGIADCKFLAKVASDWNKPDGQFAIKPERKAEFVKQLSVSVIPGIGPSFQKKLKSIGINTCEDAERFDLKYLVQKFGRSGVMLYERCRGRDNRELVEYRERKSVSTERTFSRDLINIEQCLEELPELIQEWERRVSKTAWKTDVLQPFVKIKFSDFTQTTVSNHELKANLASFRRLITEAYERKPSPVRLIGIGGKFPEVSLNQLTLF